MKLKTLKLTEAIEQRIRILRLGEENMSRGGDGIDPSHCEILKLEFADEVLREIALQTMQARDRRLGGIERPPPVAIVEVELRRKRRRA